MIQLWIYRNTRPLPVGVAAVSVDSAVVLDDGDDVLRLSGSLRSGEDDGGQA